MSDKEIVDSDFVELGEDVVDASFEVLNNKQRVYKHFRDDYNISGGDWISLSVIRAVSERIGINLSSAEAEQVLIYLNIYRLTNNILSETDEVNYLKLGVNNE